MAKIEQNLRELFRNNAPEMTEDKFVEIVGNLLTECMANQVNSRQADKRLDDVDFYDLMQSYRHTPMTEQDKTVERYEAVKDWIRQNYA